MTRTTPSPRLALLVASLLAGCGPQDWTPEPGEIRWVVPSPSPTRRVNIRPLIGLTRRNPNDYDEIQHTWEEADKRDYLIRKADTAVDQLTEAEQPKDTKSVDGLEWYDEAADYAYADPLTPDAKPRSHQILFWTFDGYLE